MVKKFVTCQGAVDDHKLSVNSISKKSCDKKNNLHSLVKVLKPKVYILADSSTFKNLVQELTGNGSIGCTSVSDTSISLSSSRATAFEPTDHEHIPIVQNNMMYTSADYGFQDISPELSFHSSDHHTGPISIPFISNFPPCAIISNLIDLEQDLVIGNNNMMYTIGDYGFQESIPELSFDSSDDHIDLIRTPVTSYFSQDIIDYMPTTLEDQEFQGTWDMMSYPLEYEAMESLFWEMESSVYNNYGSHWLQPVVPAEVCAYDCD